MAKNKGDVILRDRLQFEVDANGDVSTLYGRIDLSDYVSIPKSEGLKIHPPKKKKEISINLENSS